MLRLVVVWMVVLVELFGGRYLQHVICFQEVDEVGLVYRRPFLALALFKEPFSCTFRCCTSEEEEGETNAEGCTQKHNL